MLSVQKLVRVAALAIAVPLFTMPFAAPANASTDGGCGYIEDGAEACISANGSDIVADFYITGHPADCAGVEIYAIDDTQGTEFTKYLNGCSNGHYGWYTKTPNADGLEEFPGTNGHWYHAQLAWETGDIPEITAYSNNLLFSN